MDFVDERVGDLRTALLPPAVRFFGGPDLRAENLAFRVLHTARGIGGDAFSPAAGPFDIPFVQVAVGYFLFRHPELPVPAAEGLERPLVAAAPAVEITGQVDLRGTRGTPTRPPPGEGNSTSRR